MIKAIAVAVALAAATTVAGAQGTSTYKTAAKPTTQATTPKRHKKVKKAEESQATLQKEAKITEAAARATALKEVPNGTVKSSELERENGKLIYSFDIKTGGSDTTEVNVDAMNGDVISSKVETAAQEAAEKKQEAGKKPEAAEKK